MDIGTVLIIVSVFAILMGIQNINMLIKCKGLNKTLDAYDERIELYQNVIGKFYAPDGTPTPLNNEGRKKLQNTKQGEQDV